ncbi:GDSL-type esterase/lipase family protein [Luteolibacter sp. SL250]|uniref:GDSL-type esterase/lipase family protein n=1 Tax=Luteolibacter sp. SL250 TaxID=2995170 RepID=UPI0022705015|nr:GDSL-type esterase/lipase family protein [Luteolibacter sp. SL250]WAC18184.1 GDSL-type esterase/lipase family protein [Luteolibacter sp. SL250]
MKLAFALGFLATGMLSAEPLKVLCIGDSITQGGNKPEEYTYRLPLQRKLAEAGISYDFIGSRTKGLNAASTWPDTAAGRPFDADHEGYYGAKTAFVVTKVKAVLPKIGAPDVVLIHLGTNDQKTTDAAAEIIAPLEDLIRVLRAANPKVKVFIGQLAFNGGTSVKFRPLFTGMAERLSTADSPVVAIDHFKGWIENPALPGTDTFDWAHPNPQGQEKMAAKWFSAMTAAGVK